MELRYNEVLGTMKITLLYRVSLYIGVKKQRNIKSWDEQNYLVRLVIRGFCNITRFHCTRYARIMFLTIYMLTVSTKILALELLENHILLKIKL